MVTFVWANEEGARCRAGRRNRVDNSPKSGKCLFWIKFIMRFRKRQKSTKNWRKLSEIREFYEISQLLSKWPLSVTKNSVLIVYLTVRFWRKTRVLHFFQVHIFGVFRQWNFFLRWKSTLVLKISIEKAIKIFVCNEIVIFRLSKRFLMKLTNL